MLEKGAIKEAIHCKDQFVSHLSLVSKKDGRKTSDQPEGVELSPTLKTFSDGGAPSVKENAGAMQLSNQVRPQRRQFLCSIEQIVKEICTFRMGRFPVRIPLSVFWPWPSPKGVYKFDKSASLHSSQIVYKNNSIPRQLSNTRGNFGGNNLKQGHCDLPVTESRICYKLKEISFSPNTEKIIIGNDSRLGGDDSVPDSGDGRIDFQKVSGYIVNAGSVNKRPSKAFGNIIINSISNSSCTIVHKIPTETKKFTTFV